jgi:hypothetical protein
MKTLTLNAHAFLAAVAAVFISGCGGGGGGGGSSPPPPPPPTTFNPVFSEIQANVFTPTCATAGCHSGAGAPQGLQLDAVNSYALLVGVASNESPGVMRVAPGDPDNSYIVHKLEGTAAVGARMPLNGTPLSSANIATIRQWITDGALDDRVQTSDPIRVSSLSPLPGAALTSAPPQILVGFDRDPDPSTVNSNTFIVEASGGDGSFGDGNEVALVAADISVPGTNTASAVFDLTGVVMADDTYRVRLLGTGASMIMDMDANILDGEFTGAFPSGDSNEGGDFEATFAVTSPAPSGTTLDEIQAAVFSPTCSTAGCHSGPSGNMLPGGMDLSNADASFADLVGITSQEDANFLRVDPNNPDGSYLIQKLEGTASTGVQMPFGLMPLDQSTIDDIRTWIANGAVR